MSILLEEVEERGRAAASADPQSVKRYLSRLEELNPSAFTQLTGHPAALQFLVSVFSNSEFLSEQVLQRPGWIAELADSPDLFRVLSSEDLANRLEAELDGKLVPTPVELALFRRRQLLRILIRDVLDYATLPEITEEISNLADAVLDVTYRRIRSELVLRYGRPMYGDGDPVECGLSVIALGKLGGHELNYSSDIDLMFVYTANGSTGGTASITNKEFFKKLANQYTELLSSYTAEGLCYRVDLRLRPDGRLGEVCMSLDGMKQYYQNRARDWELQMLIKARVAAGEPGPGQELLDFVEPKIYSTTLDFSAVEAVSVTRERISEKLAARLGQKSSSSDLDVKLARGGIRDIEFLVQCLQRLHGGREPWVRHGGTLLALLRLQDKNLLSEAEYSKLASAYQFLRHLEHRLQFAHDLQTHVLPSRPEQLELIARRMPKAQLGRQPSAGKLLNQLNTHLEEVQETYDRVIHSQQPLYYSFPGPPARAQMVVVKDQPRSGSPEGSASNLIRFLDQVAPKLAATIGKSSVRRGFPSFEHFLEKVMGEPFLLAALDEDERLALDAIDLFENSPHYAEELIRHPNLIAELANIPGDLSDVEPRNYSELCETLQTPVDLRRFFRREMLRIQAISICRSAPIFSTLEQTSELADAVVRAAYHLAVQQVSDTHPPQSASYHPNEQMLVIAMGRLGMREFDLGSDADLNFVLPDEDSSELTFWTRVTERLIDVLTAYTGEGILFAADTRLRPNGREGKLLQVVSTYHEYLAKTAEAWEGITYMKSRAIVGDGEKATAFLHELQEVDWRRYGQSGRSRTDLRSMRARLEREQGEYNPLKAGPGGYYDIDFLLMYLRLKSAGIFYKVLNTPERIDIIEKMGHLEREDAEFLQDAATFYRAIDHGLRVYSGHAEGKLPNSYAHLDVLSNLVKRWTPERLHGNSLPGKLCEIQERTRRCFRRFFG